MSACMYWWLIDTHTYQAHCSSIFYRKQWNSVFRLSHWLEPPADVSVSFCDRTTSGFWGTNSIRRMVVLDWRRPEFTLRIQTVVLLVGWVPELAITAPTVRWWGLQLRWRQNRTGACSTSHCLRLGVWFPVHLLNRLHTFKSIQRSALRELPEWATATTPPSHKHTVFLDTQVATECSTITSRLEVSQPPELHTDTFCSISSGGGEVLATTVSLTLRDLLISNGSNWARHTTFNCTVTAAQTLPGNWRWN